LLQIGDGGEANFHQADHGMTELRQACKVVIGTSFSHECFLKKRTQEVLGFQQKKS